MRIRLFLVLLASLTLLFACGRMDIPEESPGTMQATESTVPTVPEESSVPVQTSSSEEAILWHSGNRILILEEESVSIYLLKYTDGGNIVYDIQIKNDSKMMIKLNVTNVLYNDCFMICNDTFDPVVPSGEWGKYYNPLPVPIAAAMGELDRIDRISFHLQLSNYVTQEVLLERDVQVDMTGDATKLKAFCRNAEDLIIQEPFLGFSALEEQLLMEKDGVRVSVCRIGKAEHTIYGDRLTYIYRVENTADDWRQFVHSGTAVNNVYYSDGGTQLNLRPGAIYYDFAHIDDIHGMERIGSVALCLGVGTETEDTTSVQADWYAVVPQFHVENPTPLKEGRLLLEEQGLRITLKTAERNLWNEVVWTLVVVNNTDRNLQLNLWDVAIGDQQGTDDEFMPVTLYPDSVGTQLCAVVTVSSSDGLPVSFRLQARDMTTGEILFITQSPIELTPS